MNLKWCKKRFFVTSSPFLHVPVFILDCVHALQGGIPHSDLEVGSAR